MDTKAQTEGGDARGLTIDATKILPDSSRPLQLYTEWMKISVDLPSPDEATRLEAAKKADAFVHKVLKEFMGSISNTSVAALQAQAYQLLFETFGRGLQKDCVPHEVKAP